MKKISILLIAIFVLSCNDKNEKFTQEISSLKKENDSIKSILTELNKKYIFDDIKVRIIPSEKNTNKIGSEYNGEFVIIGYNKSTIVNFATETEPNTPDFINPQSLKMDFGGYPFKMELKNTDNPIYFNFKLNSSYGKNFDGITFSDNKKAQ